MKLTEAAILVSHGTKVLCRQPRQLILIFLPQESKPSEAVPIAKCVLKFVVLLIASWCVMTFFHELGHIICGCACGGTLTSADLLPWHLPYSFFEPDPHPLTTLWGGPILGILIPVTIAFAIRTNWMWFIANFCILANGAYIATAWVSGDRYLDTPKLLEHGAHPISIAIYCLFAIGFGYVGFRRQCVHMLTSLPVKPPPTTTAQQAAEQCGEPE